MLTTKQKEDLIDQYIKEKHTQEECYAFCEALDRITSFSEDSDKDLKNRVKIIKLLQIIGYVDAPFKTSEWDDYHILNPYSGNITNILVKDNKVTFICLRPGFVIGKGGRNFNYIKQQIESELDQTFEFNIAEDRFWNVY